MSPKFHGYNRGKVTINGKATFNPRHREHDAWPLFILNIRLKYDPAPHSICNSFPFTLSVGLDARSYPYCNLQTSFHFHSPNRVTYDILNGQSEGGLRDEVD